MTGMSRRAVSMWRSLLVCLYAMIAGLLTADGTSAGDVVGLAVLGSIFIVFIVLADWINEAPSRGGDDGHRED